MKEELLWRITLIGSIIGALFLIYSMFFAESAPQQAAGAGIAAASAVIPYCFARAFAKSNVFNNDNDKPKLP